MANNSSNGKSSHKGAALGVAATMAAAVAAAGAYWFYGSADAAKHRKQVRGFMLKARADVLAAVEKMRDIDKEQYMKIVDQVVARYSGLAGITAAEIAQMTRDLKAAWTHMHAAKRTIDAARSPKKSPAKKKSSAKRASAKKKQS